MEIFNLYNITLIDGDGIGPEITQAVVDIIEAAGVKINWDNHEINEFNADISISRCSCL